MTEIDTSRANVEKYANATVFITPEAGADQTSAMLRAILARAEKAERERDEAWNAAIEAAAQWLKDECLGVTAENMIRALKRGSTDD